MFDIHTLNKKLLPELKDIGKELGVPKYQKLKKQELIYEILDAQATQASTKVNHKKEDKIFCSFNKSHFIVIKLFNHFFF